MGAAELAVLEVLWRGEALSIRRITDELYPRGETSDYATVQKLLFGAPGVIEKDAAPDFVIS